MESSVDYSRDCNCKELSGCKVGHNVVNALDFLALLCLPIVMVYLVVVFVHVRSLVVDETIKGDDE